jgi:hypothetical protein
VFGEVAKNYFLKQNVLILAQYTVSFTNGIPKKITKSLKLLSILLEALRDPFVTAAEAASQSSPDITNNLHKMKAVKEGLLVGKSTSTPPPQRII